MPESEQTKLLKRNNPLNTKNTTAELLQPVADLGLVHTGIIS